MNTERPRKEDFCQKITFKYEQHMFYLKLLVPVKSWHQCVGLSRDYSYAKHIDYKQKLFWFLRSTWIIFLFNFCWLYTLAKLSFIVKHSLFLDNLELHSQRPSLFENHYYIIQYVSLDTLVPFVLVRIDLRWWNCIIAAFAGCSGTPETQQLQISYFLLYNGFKTVFWCISNRNFPLGASICSHQVCYDPVTNVFTL